EQLRQEVQALKAQIAAIPASGAAPSAGAVTAPAQIEAAQVPPVTPAETSSEETGLKKSSVKIYGAAMLDLGYQAGASDPDWFDVMRATKLPSFRDEFGKGGHTYTGVRQSRFGVKTSTPTAWGDLKTIFEFELFGTGVDAGQTTFRLRHAWGEL